MPKVVICQDLVSSVDLHRYGVFTIELFRSKLVALRSGDTRNDDVLTDLIGLRLVNIVAAAIPVECGPGREVVAEVDVAHVLVRHDGALRLVPALR